MAGVETSAITVDEVEKILAVEESHFVEMKSRGASPARLSKTLSGFANAEGGELFIGIDERNDHSKVWGGFDRPEDANGMLQAFESVFPLGQEFSYTFLTSENHPGYVLRAEIQKSPQIRPATDGKVYVRRGAQNLPIATEEDLARLKHNKGLTSFETELLNAELDLIANSTHIIAFMLQVVPTAEPEQWLSKQRLIVNGKPTVAGALLFAEEPQAVLPKRCGLKIYRYKTSDEDGTRDTLDFDPVSIEGCAYDQVKVAVEKTRAIIEAVRVNTPTGLEAVAYPPAALHEIITNAVLHRDYSIADDIHIRIFDNRVEVVSPGTLPAHITPENILNERFARNPTIVRLINKFPDPPNKDVGEGLNTAFQAMREMKLRAPEVTQSGASVKVVLRHEPLATPEEVILDFLKSHPQVTNRDARAICFIGSENTVKRVFQGMIKRGMIELVPGTTRYTAAYRLVALEGDAPHD